MGFREHVQNLHIRAEKTHKEFGAHCTKYVNFVHDPEKQYMYHLRQIFIHIGGSGVTSSILRISGRPSFVV